MQHVALWRAKIAPIFEPTTKMAFQRPQIDCLKLTFQRHQIVRLPLVLTTFKDMKAAIYTVF